MVVNVARLPVKGDKVCEGKTCRCDSPRQRKWKYRDASVVSFHLSRLRSQPRERADSVGGGILPPLSLLTPDCPCCLLHAFI
jgi:hypothetical protein